MRLRKSETRFINMWIVYENTLAIRQRSSYASPNETVGELVGYKIERKKAPSCNNGLPIRVTCYYRNAPTAHLAKRLELYNVIISTYYGIVKE